MFIVYLHPENSEAWIDDVPIVESEVDLMMEKHRSQRVNMSVDALDDLCGEDVLGGMDAEDGESAFPHMPMPATEEAQNELHDALGGASVSAASKRKD